MMPTLPPELIIIIAEALPTSSLSVLSRTCQAYHHLLTPLLNGRFDRQVAEIREYAILSNKGPLLSRALATGGSSQPTGRDLFLAVRAGADRAMRILLDYRHRAPNIITLKYATYFARRNGGGNGSKEILEMLLETGACAGEWRVQGEGVNLSEWEKALVARFGSGKVKRDGYMVIGTPPGEEIAAG